MIELSLEHLQEDNNKHKTQQVNFSDQSKKNVVKIKKKRIRKYTSNNPNNQKGHWTEEQNVKYHIFLELHALNFLNRENRKTDKIFKSMANFIETRQPHQCRSHHQKIKKKWGAFLDILRNLRLQNYKRADSRPVIKQLQSLGFENRQILSEQDLGRQQRLWQKMMEKCEKQNISTEEHKTEEENQVDEEWDNISKCPKQNCMCLMMSQNYEDQLFIE